MRFYPESIVSEYEPQSDVWDIVREALKDEDGVAWHGYSRYRKGLADEYASDIVVLSRRYGALIIECAGCEIGNIYAINNTAWQMEDWYQEQITPVSQVESQKFAIQYLLRQKIPYAEKVCYRLMVALPFITEEEWEKSGFAGETGVRYVALKEQLTVTKFLEWLEVCQREQPQPQSADAEWLALCEILERSWNEAARPVEEVSTLPVHPNLSGQERLVFLSYEGEPLADDVLRKRIKLPYLDNWTGKEPMPDYWYLVPTAGLEWHRRNLAPNIQVQGRLRRQIDTRHEFGVKLIFRKALTRFMSLQPTKPTIATRVNELVYLSRIMRTLDVEPERREQLWRDRYAWIEAFRAMEERGLDLTVHPLEYEHLFVHPDMAVLMGKMQAAFRQQLAEQSEVTFEAAARTFLESDDFQPPSLVVMEGFTHLTPLQLFFIECCLRHPTCTIWFIRPFRTAQAEGFEAVEEEYRDLLALPYKEEQEQLRNLREPVALMALQRSLFSEDIEQGKREPGSVVIEAYPTRQQEVAACVRHLKNYLDANPEHRIAVVTRDPLKYRTLLREEAILLDPALAERFDIPPIHLLLTPVGRFVLSLYESWQNKKLALKAEQFRRILSSGWLGRRAKNSVPLFQSLEPAFFARCQDQNSWQQAFTALAAAVSESVGGRSLAAWCTPDDVALWRKTLEVVISLVQQLFDEKRRSLSKQIQRLQEKLETIDLQDVQEDEREIIQRILAVLQSFADSSELELDGEEVGEVLNSLIRQREDAEDHKRITMTGPESLDGLQKDVVYYLGVDEHRVPRAPGDEWPLAELDIARNQAQERYSFLATVRAAKKYLHLTYAEIDDRQACAPSLYLDEVVQVLGRGQVPLAERSANGEEEKVEVSIRPVGAVQRNTYAIGELAQFQVCPRRYYLQRMTRTASYYRDPWQVSFFIQGALLTYALAAFRTQYPSGVAVEEFPEILAGSAFDAALAQARAMYTGYAEEDWFFLAQQTRRRLVDSLIWMRQSWAGRIVCVESRQDLFIPLQGDSDRIINMRVPARFVIFGINGGSSLSYVYTGDLLAEEWLLPSKKDNTEHSRYLAVRWWSELIKKFVKYGRRVRIGDPIRVSNVEQDLPSIEKVILQVENSMYQAHPGEKCSYCPVKSLCLGWQTGGLL